MEVKLRDHKYANCYAVITDDTIELVSYSTVVCKITDINGVMCLCGYGRFTATTCKHIRWFTEQFCGVNLYHICKKGSYKNPVCISINCECLAAELRRLRDEDDNR